MRNGFDIRVIVNQRESDLLEKLHTGTLCNRITACFVRVAEFS